MNNATFVAQSINIGDTAEDSFNAGSISFNAGHVLISENSDTFLSRSNQAIFLTLASEGDIRDHGNAETTVNRRADLSGIDLVVGELAEDCFDILTGTDGLTTEALGVTDILLGC